jgi:signal peptidase
MSTRLQAMNSERLKTVVNVIGLLVLVAAVLPFVTTAFPAAVGAEQVYVVTSGSMEPAIGVGDLVYVYDADPSTIQEGDIITYDIDDDSQVTTHRVIEVLDTEQGLQFQTKGDANEDPDQYRVPAEAVIGKVRLSLPLVGRAVVFANSRMGILTLLIIPAALLIINEAYTLGKAYMAAKNAEQTEETGTEESGSAEPAEDPRTDAESGGDD